MAEISIICQQTDSPIGAKLKVSTTLGLKCHSSGGFGYRDSVSVHGVGRAGRLVGLARRV